MKAVHVTTDRRTSQEKAQWGERKHWKDPGFKNTEEEDESRKKIWAENGNR